MKLTVKLVDSAKPEDRDYKLSDGQGLSLLVKSSGKKLWRYRYTFEGKEKMISLGSWPSVSLAEARNRSFDAKKKIAAGADPSGGKKKKTPENKKCFSDFFYEWVAMKEQNWAGRYKTDLTRRMQKYILPALGKLALTEIEPLILLNELKNVEKTGKLATEKSLRHTCSQIFSYAIVTGLMKFNPAYDLRTVMPGTKAKHFAFLKKNELPKFFMAIDNLKQQDTAEHIALNLVILTGLRHCELLNTVWDWIDFDEGIWFIPADFMKKRRPHLVPLTRQMIALLEKMKKYHSDTCGYVFPGKRVKQMGRRSLLLFLEKAGYKGRATVHGFRHTFSTILHEKRFPTDLIEMQLAHVDGNQVRGIYNHAIYTEERRKMLQWYSDFIDEMKGGIQTKALPELPVTPEFVTRDMLPVVDSSNPFSVHTSL